MRDQGIQVGTLACTGGASNNGVVFASATPTTCTVTNSTATVRGAGLCTLSADQAGDINISAAPQVAQSFAVDPASQSIAFGALPDRKMGDAPFNISATATSNLAVGFTSATAAVCAVTGTTVTLAATGTCTIQADQAGDSRYGAAPQVTQSFTVSPAGVQVYYIHSDHLNTPRVITDAGNNLVWRWDSSEAFGNNAPNENPNNRGIFNFNLRFAGQYFDKETGLHYNYFRDCYDPATGRYCQSDPIGLAGGVNTYTYVNGNPLRWTDPTGLDVYVANTDAVGGLHQKIVVDTPNGQYGQSFGMSSRDLPQQGLWEAYQGHQQPGLPGSGVIYSDSDPITKIQRRFETTQQEDALIEAYLKFQRDWTGPYNVASNSCRDYSNRQYDIIVKAIQNLRAGQR